MIRKLRWKLIRIAMLSLLVILLVVFCGINGAYWYQFNQESEAMLSYLAENNGDFRGISNNAQIPPSDVPSAANGTKALTNGDTPTGGGRFPVLRFNAETAYRTRCFSVTLTADGEFVSARMDRIAAVTQSQAIAYAQEILAAGQTGGFRDIYRYTVQERGDTFYFGFLDCSREISVGKSLLIRSAIIVAGCLIAMFLLVFFYSKRAIRPIIENMEKQKQFITDAGHELKTPLSIISANTDVLSLTIGENEWVDSIRNQTRRLGKLTQELLALTRLEEDRRSIEFADFSLSEAVYDQAAAFQPLAQARGQRMELMIQPDIMFHGSEVEIRRMVGIFLDNAIKYAQGDIPIQLMLKHQGHETTLCVVNGCAPIEAAKLPHLFERFYRVDSARASAAVGGYGIGLSIAKEIAALHKGKLTASCPTRDTFAITFQQG